MRRPSSAVVNGPTTLRHCDDTSDSSAGFFVKFAEHGSPFDIQLDDDEGEDVMAVNGVSLDCVECLCIERVLTHYCLLMPHVAEGIEVLLGVKTLGAQVCCIMWGPNPPQRGEWGGKFRLLCNTGMTAIVFVLETLGELRHIVLDGGPGPTVERAVHCSLCHTGWFVVIIIITGLYSSSL